MQFVEGQSLAEVIAELQCGGPIDQLDANKSVAALVGLSEKSVPGRSESKVTQAEKETVERALDGTDKIKQPGLATTGRLSSSGELAHSRSFFRFAAQIGVQAAEALDHAHARGIVHRDVKPGNLMLDVEGKVHVADFGLARMGEDAGMTMTGDVLGTIRYMSPEQALAKHAIIDHRTDVYSLGATLYELLTLSPLFKGNDRQELLRKITLEEPQQPGKLNTKIPIDLETIVLKAIAKDPTDRYATAQEMAEDLQRFIDGKPVQALRLNASQRLWRWSKRNPVVAVLSISIAALATLVAIVATIGYAQTSVALAQAQQQEQQTAEQRDRAEQQFRNAKDAVDRMLITAANKLENVPNSGEVRRELLEDALQFYEGFLETRSSDPAIRYETALTYSQVGKIRAQFGDRDAARIAYHKSIKIIEKLAEEFPENADYQEELTNRWRQVGGVERFLNSDLNLHYQRKSLDGLKKLVAAYPDRLGYREMLATCYSGVGNALIIAGRLPDAMPYYQQAVDKWEQLHKDFPQHPKNLARIANSYHWYGAGLLRQNKLEEAEEMIEKSHSIKKQLHQENPRRRWYRYVLVVTKHYLARLRREQGRIQETEIIWREAMKLNQKLIEDFPNEWEFRRRYSQILRELAMLLAENKKEKESQILWHKLTDQSLVILELVPDDPFTIASAGNKLMV
jgi:tetratricopeptide (TPR) repeat protein